MPILPLVVEEAEREVVVGEETEETVEVGEVTVEVKIHLAVCAKTHLVLSVPVLPVEVAEPPVGVQTAVLSAVALECSNSFYE